MRQFLATRFGTLAQTGCLRICMPRGWGAVRQGSGFAEIVLHVAIENDTAVPAVPPHDDED